MGVVPAVTAICAMHGQTLAVQPVNVVLLPGQKIATLTLRNPASEAITVQARPYLWNQNGNEDPLNPTEAMLVSPPMATIQAGESQIIRVAMRQVSAGRETTYRLLLDQLPGPSPQKGIAILLRLSIPVFVESDAHASPRFDFHVEHHRDGKSFLVVSNSGQCHDSIRDIRLKGSDGTTWKVAVPGLPYVLVGSERRWPIIPEGTSHELPGEFSLNAQTDAGVVTRQLTVTEAP
jgi:fimbrial chaperone protein